jgi:hypothetical protein
LSGIGALGPLGPSLPAQFYSSRSSEELKSDVAMPFFKLLLLISAPMKPDKILVSSGTINPLFELNIILGLPTLVNNSYIFLTCSFRPAIIYDYRLVYL